MSEQWTDVFSEEEYARQMPDRHETELPVSPREEGISPDELTSSHVDDPIKQYLDQISRVPLLKAEEEVELAKIIEAGLYAEQKIIAGQYDQATLEELRSLTDAGRRAKQHFVEANLRLVVSVANKRKRNDMGLLDAVQMGNLGLIHAVEKFDYTLGFKFSTYADWWIRQAIMSNTEMEQRPVRLPAKVITVIHKIVKAEQNLKQIIGQEPSLDDMAAEVEMSPEEVLYYRRLAAGPLSLDSEIKADSKDTYGDLFVDAEEPSPEDLVMEWDDRQDMLRAINLALDTLAMSSEKDDVLAAAIIRWRYGFMDGRPRTCQEVGDILDVPPSRVSNISRRVAKAIAAAYRMRTAQER